TATRKALPLLGPLHPLGNHVTQQLRQCEQCLKLDSKLPDILKGDTKAANATEEVDLAYLCQQYKKRYAAAARFFSGAFAADPDLADDLESQVRYNAACAAALAAAGKGEDAGRLKDQERTKFRQQALKWLQADLAAWTRVIEKGPASALAMVKG